MRYSYKTFFLLEMFYDVHRIVYISEVIDNVLMNRKI